MDLMNEREIARQRNRERQREYLCLNACVCTATKPLFPSDKLKHTQMQMQFICCDKKGGSLVMSVTKLQNKARDSQAKFRCVHFSSHNYSHYNPVSSH